MKPKKKSFFVCVLNMHGVPLPQSCSSAKAEAMVAKGEAVWVETESKPTIQLTKPWSPKGMFYR